MAPGGKVIARALFGPREAEKERKLNRQAQRFDVHRPAQRCLPDGSICLDHRHDNCLHPGGRITPPRQLVAQNMKFPRLAFRETRKGKGDWRWVQINRPDGLPMIPAHAPITRGPGLNDHHGERPSPYFPTNPWWSVGEWGPLPWYTQCGYPGYPSGFPPNPHHPGGPHYGGIQPCGPDGHCPHHGPRHNTHHVRHVDHPSHISRGTNARNWQREAELARWVAGRRSSYPPHPPYVNTTPIFPPGYYRGPDQTISGYTDEDEEDLWWEQESDEDDWADLEDDMFSIADLSNSSSW